MLNQTFYKILESYAVINDEDKYKKAPQTEKKKIEREIINTLMENPTFRMLKNSHKIHFQDADESNEFKIYIVNTDHSSFPNGVFLVYSFNKDGSKITLSLNYRDNLVSLNSRKLMVNRLNSSINLNNRSNFTKTDYDGSSIEGSLLSRSYTGRLKNKVLEDDLKWVYEVYFKVFNAYKQNMGVLKKKKQMEDEKKKKILKENGKRLSEYFVSIITHKVVVDKKSTINTIFNILGNSQDIPKLKKYYQIHINESERVKIHIWDNRYFDSTFNQGIYIVYSFAKTKKEFSLSIEQGKKFPPGNKRKTIAKEFQEDIVKNKKKYMKNISKKKLNKLVKNGVKDDAIAYKQYFATNNSNVLVNDLLTVFKIYNDLCKNYNNKIEKLKKEDGLEDNEEMSENSLSKSFKKIFDSYNEGKYGILSQDDEDILKNNIINILRSIKTSKMNKKPYNDFSHEGIQIFIQKGIGHSNRVKIYIGHEKCNNFSVNNGLFLLYSFSDDGSRIKLSLSIGDESISKDVKAQLVKSLKNVNAPVGFSKLRGKGTGNTILRIGHSGNNLDDKWLERDLKNLYYLYLSQINQYNNLLNKLINKKPDIKFYQYLYNKGFIFSKEIMENYLLSLKVKPFVILTGNSGTGKTKLSQLFAEYLQENMRDNHAIVPVGANWTENRNVVGYYNVLTKSYQHTQSLDLLLRAKEDPDNPYFLILDEMNLSHVERYFSDFLSSMESEKPIPLHKAGDVDDVPQELTIPPNLFIVGTVNVDETTYMFSPKVLDRANVLEFKTFENISMKDYVKNNPPEIEFEENVDYLENPLSDIGLRENILSVVNGRFSNVKCNEVSRKIVKSYVLFEISRALTQFNKYLEGSGFEFGYRTVNEILAFMYVAWKYEGEQRLWNNWKGYLDAQILQKILPKLHGSQMVLGETLDNLLTYCLGLDSIDDAPELEDIDDSYPYPESAKKLLQMKNVLEKQRYVSFIN